ncbi:hypothetical protein M8R20_02450 [Pseudomonas sp. R2.Fl]|nr:hypothetical protein [Pseudomonas sp. R2.Fl]
MAQEQKPGGNRQPNDSEIVQGFDRMISSKLRRLYDDVVEEGTPDRLLDLLEKLEAAERAAEKSKL